MSSLYSLLRKGKLVYGEPADAELVYARDSYLQLARVVVKPPNCILVNADSVRADIFEKYRGSMQETGQALRELPPLSPPFPVMWIENTGYFGALVFRSGEASRFQVEIVIFGHLGYAAGLFGVYRLHLSEGGTVQDSGGNLFVEKRDDGAWKVFFPDLFVALHALARMNCRNVKLEPIDGPKLIPHHQTKPVPASVWHKITITDVPKRQTTGRDGFGRDEKLIRSHWVRGHYADYREKGLFGRPQSRGIYWIPEHKRGNEELGQVIPEYAVC